MPEKLTEAQLLAKIGDKPLFVPTRDAYLPPTGLTVDELKEAAHYLAKVGKLLSRLGHGT